MRALPSIASLSLLMFAAAACTVETRTIGEAPTKDAGEPAPLPGKTASKDGGTSQPPMNGPTTCRGAAECLGECDDGDDACQDPCLASLPPAEMAELEALAICIQNSDCADMECLQETCASEFAECAGQ
jgi:hypothetical protein